MMNGDTNSIRSLYQKYIMNDHEFVSRDSSWVEFNRRVLYQAKRSEIPLKERMKFLGITSNNLDEFLMVRLGSNYHKMQDNPDSLDIAGKYACEEEEELLEKIEDLRSDMRTTYEVLKERMEERRVKICTYKDLDQDERRKLNNIFMDEIFPVLVPLAFDRTHADPIIKSKDLTMVVLAADKNEMKNPQDVMCFISLDKVKRVWTIETGDMTKVVLVEEIVRNNLSKIFINMRIKNWGVFRLLRDVHFLAEGEPDEPIADIVAKTLVRRKDSKPMMMEATETLHASVVNWLAEYFDVDKEHVHVDGRVIDYTFLMKMPELETLEGESYEEYVPQISNMIPADEDIFTTLSKRDLLLHHPYDSYDTVVDLVETAADDPDVVSIRQTLYRVSSLNSPIVSALCRAAEKGKQVSVLVEVKARFDEELNLKVSQKLINSGCIVSNGVEGLKSHCKMLSIVRKEKHGYKYYSHIGTGNYNDKTAKMYADISYMSSNKAFGRDLVTAFNILSGYSKPENSITTIAISPNGIRGRLEQLIDKETKKRNKGSIDIVVNSFSDERMIKKLYDANDKGVHINIVCRGVCSASTMRSNGTMRKNFTIKSIVGRYLEHARIYRFGHGKHSTTWVASADLLARNLDRRVEFMVPITDTRSRRRVNQILELMLNDTVNSFFLLGTEWYKGQDNIGGKIIDCHSIFMRRMKRGGNGNGLKIKNKMKSKKIA